MASAEIDLRYVETGRGDPVVLLDWTPWETRKLADTLSERFRVISVAPPGDARSTDSPQKAAWAVARVVDHLELDSFSLVGTSVGADAAFRLALERPDAVNTLILVSPTCVSQSEPQKRSTPEFAATAMLAHPDAAEALPNPQRTAALGAMAELWQATNQDALDLLPDLSCTTLVVLGQEDRLVGRTAGGAWKGRVPNCSLSYVYDAGHAVGVDRPDALANVVLDFLERRETYIVENRSSLINP